MDPAPPPDNNAILASLGSPTDPFASGEGDPNSQQQKLLRIMQAHQMQDTYRRMLESESKPQASQYDQNLQELSKHVGNPWNIDPLTHTGKGGAADMLANLPFALMGLGPSANRGSGYVLSPKSTQLIKSMVPDTNTNAVPEWLNPNSSKLPPDITAANTNTKPNAQGPQINYGDPSTWPDSAKYHLAQYNQAIERALGGKNMSLVPKSGAPTSSQLLQNSGIVNAANPIPVKPGFTSKPRYQPANDEMSVPVSQRSWNNHLLYNPELNPDGQ